MPGPARFESSSVAFPITAAGGTTAIAEAMNTARSLASASSSTTASGIAGERRYGQLCAVSRRRGLLRGREGEGGVMRPGAESICWWPGEMTRRISLTR